MDALTDARRRYEGGGVQVQPSMERRLQIPRPEDCCKEAEASGHEQKRCKSEPRKECEKRSAGQHDKHLESIEDTTTEHGSSSAQRRANLRPRNTTRSRRAHPACRQLQPRVGRSFLDTWCVAFIVAGDALASRFEQGVVVRHEWLDQCFVELSRDAREGNELSVVREPETIGILKPSEELKENESLVAG